MSIRVHIDRLILDGLPPGPLDTKNLSEAVSSELGRLLGETGLQPRCAAGGSFSTVRGADIPPPERGSGQLGVQIAAAISGALGRSGTGRG
jgi:hypothetical protein